MDDRFEIGARLGAGGMGAVYAGLHRPTGQPVAIKQVRPDLAGDPNFREAFATEAWTVAGLDHPGVVRVFHVGEVGGQLSLVTELAAGTLASTPLGQRAPWATVRPLLELLLETLAWLHARDVVHGDLSPGNVLTGCRVGDVPLPTPLAGVRLADFGLARRGRAGQASGGTAGFAAPEQLAGGPPTRAGDLYALGRIAARVGEATGDAAGWVDWLTARDPADRPRCAAEALDRLPRTGAEAAAPWVPADDEVTRPVLQALSVTPEVRRPAQTGGSQGLPESWRRKTFPDVRAAAWTVSPALLAVREGPPVGRDLELDAVWAHVRDPAVGVVAVWGPPGVGAGSVRREIVWRAGELGGHGWIGAPELGLPELVERARVGPVVIALQGELPPWVGLLAAAPDAAPGVTVLVDRPLPGARAVEVGALGEDLVGLALIAGARLEGGWARRLAAACGGRVGLAVRHVRALAAEGALTVGTDGLTTSAERELPRPGGLPALPDAARDGLERLALLGRPAEPSLWARIAPGLRRSQAVARGWLAADRAGLDPQIALAARASAARDGRAGAHHGVLADALPSDTPEAALARATHALAGGREALGLALIAGLGPDPFVAAPAIQRAAGDLLAAHAEALDRAPADQRAALLRLLAGWRADTPGYDALRERATHAAAGDPALLARISLDHAAQAVRAKQIPEASACLDHARALLGPAPSAADTHRLRSVEMLLAFYQGQPTFPDIARGLLAAGAPSASRAAALLADWHTARGPVEEAVRFARDAVARADDRYVGEALGALFVAQRRAGLRAEAEATLDALERACLRTGELTSLARAGLLRAHLLREAGEAERALEVLVRTQARYEASGRPSLIVTLVLGLLLGGSLRRLDELARLTPAGFGEPLEAQMPALQAPFALHLAMVALGLGQPDRASGWLDRFEGALGEVPLDPDGVWLLDQLALYAGPPALQARFLSLAQRVRGG